MKNRIGRGQDVGMELVAALSKKMVRLSAIEEMFNCGMSSEEVVAKIAA